MGVVFFISLYMLLWVSTETNVVRARADRIESRIKDLQVQVETTRLEKEKRARDQYQPEVKEQERVELASARNLIDRKSFSWNRMLNDIERFIPRDARVASLKIQEMAAFGQTPDAAIEIKVMGRAPSQMTEMMEELEKSGGLFLVRQSSQDAPDESGEVPFSLNMIYSQSRGASQ